MINLRKSDFVMSNNSTIKCPNCHHEFEPNDAIKMEIQERFRKEAQEWKSKKEEEYRKKDEEYQKQLTAALSQQKTAIENQVKKSLTDDFENQVKLLSDTNKANEQKLKLAREKELEFLKKEQDLKTKEAELEIQLQKKLGEERLFLAETIKKQETERHALTLKEYEKKLEDQKKLIDEMQRKAEQGSMQMQGEVQELALEELLRTTYPFDAIEEVAKGVRGADCVQVVRNNFAHVCGKIIYESKRTKAFTNDWIEKLKADMRSQQADIAVIVSEVLPKDMPHFGFKDGVWICKFSDVKPLSFLLRDSLLRIYMALQSQENKGDKMQMLYDFLTGNEFKQNIEAVMEGFLSLKDGLTKEKMQMEKIWKEREKQLDKVLLNTTQFYGSMKGIAGNAIADLKMLE